MTLTIVIALLIIATCWLLYEDSRAARQPQHYGHPDTWFNRHAPDDRKVAILKGRVKHARDVARFFENHPGLARTKQGRNAAWQHRRMGKWARRELRELLWRPPLLAGEKPYHATLKNPVNRNLIRIAICETGGINGGRPLWTHSNSTYAGALGFLHSTWRQFRVYVRPLPPRYAHRATMLQQLAVGRELVRRYGYTPWPACHVRLGIY